MADQPILVAGGTGGTGREIVKHLQNDGKSVRVMTRDVAKGRTVLGAYVDLITADATVPATLPVAFDGIELFICTIGSNAVMGQETPEDIDYGGVKNLVDAAKAAGVRHMVLVSSLGVTQPDHPINKYGRVLEWKYKGEEHLRASGLTYTIVRPGGLTDDDGGQGLQFGQGDRISGRIPREDVALVCVKALENPNAYGKTLDIISGDDAAPTDFDAIFQSLHKDNAIP